MSVQSFIIKYVPKSNTSVWEWKLHDEVNDVALVEGKDIYISFTYVPGVRENEAEYVATFTGKKIVFDSKKQVKFFYNNDKLVVDNETNLAERDKLFLKYYTTIANDSSNGLNELINIGTAQVSNVVTPGDNTVTFDADGEPIGAGIGPGRDYNILTDDVNQRLVTNHQITPNFSIQNTKKILNTFSALTALSTVISLGI